MLVDAELPLEGAELFDELGPEAVVLGNTRTCSSRLSLYFPVERFEIGIRIYPRRFLGRIDDERGNNYDDCTDNQYREPNGIATG